MGEFVSGIAVKGEDLFRLYEAEEAEKKAALISAERKCPVLSAYIYDGDFWGYTLYINGEMRNEFATIPDYFEAGEAVIRRYTADLLLLSQAFAVAPHQINRYLCHWTDKMIDKGNTAYEDDEFSYGDAWQLVNFLERLGFCYPELLPAGQVDMPIPILRDILEHNIPPRTGERTIEEYPLINKLPSAFSLDYIRSLLEEKGVQEFQFEDKTPPDIIQTIQAYRLSVCQRERDALCQRLAVLAAFCSFWMCIGHGWGQLDGATYEPICLNYEKPTDIYILRARAAVTDYSKHNRALRDLQRLLELDPTNSELYQDEIDKWNRMEQEWKQTHFKPTPTA